jgi:hypothetical protein
VTATRLPARCGLVVEGEMLIALKIENALLTLVAEPPDQDVRKLGDH